MIPELGMKMKGAELIIVEKKYQREDPYFAYKMDNYLYDYKMKDIDNNVYITCEWMGNLGEVGDKITLKKGHIRNKIIKNDGGVEWKIQTGSQRC